MKKYFCVCTFSVNYITAVEKIGTQCVHVSAIWKFNDQLGKKAMHVSRMKDICLLSQYLWGFTVDVGKPGT